MNRYIGRLTVLGGIACAALSIGPFSAALREYEDTPDWLMIAFGVALLMFGGALVRQGLTRARQ